MFTQKMLPLPHFFVQAMKKPILLFTFVCSCTTLAAQEQIGLGAMAGITTYWGDFNNTRIIANPDIMAGALLRYSFNDYYNLRLNAAGGFLRGDPAAYGGASIEQSINKTPQPFRKFFFDVDLRFEVGFLPYNPFGDKGRLRFTPYFAVGAGIFYSKNEPHLQLPLALGIKYRLTYRWTLGLEWVVAKTFTDDIDDWENIRPQNASFFMNNDWVTHLSINLVYQLFDDRICRDCDH
jgi:hypothetical protein